MASHTGIVKWFDSERGYGFISVNQGEDVFVHLSQVKETGANKDIREGEHVSFDIVQGQKGPSAANVQKL